MKISLHWISRHLSRSYHDIPWDATLALFNKKVAEIDAITPVTLDKNDWYIAQITTIDKAHGSIMCFIPESNTSVSLPYRSDACKDYYYLIYKNNWASFRNALCDKEGYIPPITCKQSHMHGLWKEDIVWEDYLITLSNTSITHRPDLWGHRGLAREIALLCNSTLIPEEQLVYTIPIKTILQESALRAQVIHSTDACSALAALYLPLPYQPCHLSGAFDLMRIGSRPINALVDATNYVMFDWGYPLHAFDADTIADCALTARFAYDKEQLSLLDGTTITLSPHDIVIADHEKALSLAGIMGGLASSITPQTRAALIEVGCFDATTVRHSSDTYKKRTEASTRFEKGMDSTQVPLIVQRYVRILADWGLFITDSHQLDAIVLWTQSYDRPPSITITQSLISAQLGYTDLEPHAITTFLTQLGCNVTYTTDTHDTVYTIDVPSFRAKDLQIREDIVEEIARCIGYDAIPLQLPLFPRKSFSSAPTHSIRMIKNFFASALACHELQSYAFFNESFLNKINYKEHQAEKWDVINPVSENWRSLNTVLTPHLFEALEKNSPTHDVLRFFEWGRIWKKTADNPLSAERFQLAGIFWTKHTHFNFYEGKQLLQSFFHYLSLTVSWHKTPYIADSPWYHPHETAQLMLNNTTPCGYAGTISADYLSSFAPGHGFTFIIDGTTLLSAVPVTPSYQPPHKYQAVIRDISILINKECTVESLQNLIISAHPFVTQVMLTDFFEQKEWHNTKSLTFRITLNNPTKTMTKEEIDAICTIIYNVCRTQGATVR